MLPKEKTMEVLEAYDLTKSYRAAAQLTGVNHHTVARLVAARALGTEMTGEPVLRSKTAEAFADKIAEWIERSSGKVRADVVHDKLVAMGYQGSARTTRRVVAALKAARDHDRHRVYKPWITEPGAWLQYDFGAGPVIDGVAVVLFCAWLAWSCYRVIIPLGDRTWPSVVAALDTTFRSVGGAPTYVLTDNERTLTDGLARCLATRILGRPSYRPPGWMAAPVDFVGSVGSSSTLIDEYPDYSRSCFAASSIAWPSSFHDLTTLLLSDQAKS